jgi:hypothetical protein
VRLVPGIRTLVRYGVLPLAVIATLALDSAPVCHDPHDRARASDFYELRSVSTSHTQVAWLVVVLAVHYTIIIQESHTFSCQLSKTLIACPPPSPPPRACTCEKPVA